MNMKMQKGVLAGLVATAFVMALPAAAQTTTMKIYSARMPDGSLMLSDRPPAGAKGGYETSTYALPEPKQRAAIEADREYWRRQSEAFDRRQAQRDAMSSRGGRHVSTSDYRGMEPVGYVIGSHGYASRPLVPPHLVPRVYESSPGAVRGRSPGFIGSGFSTAR